MQKLTIAETRISKRIKNQKTHRLYTRNPRGHGVFAGKLSIRTNWSLAKRAIKLQRNRILQESARKLPLVNADRFCNREAPVDGPPNHWAAPEPITGFGEKVRGRMGNRSQRQFVETGSFARADGQTARRPESAPRGVLQFSLSCHKGRGGGGSCWPNGASNCQEWILLGLLFHTDQTNWKRF